MENSIPNLQDLMQYDVNRRGQYEGIRQSLYDFLPYSGTGESELQFFQQPKGQNGKTIHDTNMSSAGQLPQPQHFLVESIEVMFLSPDAPAGFVDNNSPGDAYTVLTAAGALDFFIGSKTYLEEAPLGRFPPKTRYEFTGFTDASITQFQIGVGQTVGRPYYMDPPVLLVPNQNFSVTLSWKTKVPPASGLTGGRIGVILDGILYRQSQ